MKSIRTMLLLSVCTFALGAFAQQNPPAQGGGDQQGRRRGMPSVEDQLKNLTEKLSLTDTLPCPCAHCLTTFEHVVND